MDDVPICPEWWPRSLWSLHFAKIPFKRPGVGPINMPAPVDALLVSLQTHTASYLMADEKVAKQVRSAALKNMAEMIKKMAD